MVRLRSPAPYGSVPERPKGADCKSVVTDFGGPNPPAPTNKKTLSHDKVFLLVGFALQKGGFGSPLIKYHGVMFLCRGLSVCSHLRQERDKLTAKKLAHF